MSQMNGNWREDAIEKSGGNGKYQYWVFVNFSLKWLLSAMTLFSINFFYLTPNFLCKEDQPQEFSTCQDYVCSHSDPMFWIDHLQKPIYSSISLDYGYIMLCNQKWISSTIQAIGYLGAFFGYLVMSYLANRFGRKIIEQISWIIYIIGLIFMVFSGTKIHWIIIGTFMANLGANAAMTLHYSFINQFFIGNFRERSIIALQIMFSLGISGISLIAIFIKQWKIIVGWFILLPSVLLAVFSHFLLEETLTFSHYQNTNQKLNTLKKIALINKTILADDDLQFIEKAIKTSQQKQQKQKISISLVSMMRESYLKETLLICGLIDFIVSFLYNGSLLSLDKLRVDIYWDQILVGLVQILAALYSSWIIITVKRGQFGQYALIYCGKVCMILGFLNLFFSENTHGLSWYSIGQMLLLAIFRFLLTSAWGVFYVHISELIPLQTTSIAFGFISSIGTLGAFASPYIRLAAAKTAFFLEAGFCLSGAYLFTKLRETKENKDFLKNCKQKQDEEMKLVQIIEEN